MRRCVLVLVPLLLALPLVGEEPAGPKGVGVFLAQAAGGEKDLYKNGGGLEFTWHFRPGRRIQHRVRTGLFTLGAGSMQGRFSVPYEAHSEGLSIDWDFLFVPDGRRVLPFIGIGGCFFRYSVRKVPDFVTTVDPSHPEVRDENTDAVGLDLCAGLIVPINRAVELELRFEMVRHGAVAVVGPVAEGFLGDSLNPAPSHLALGVRWRF